MRAGSLRHRVKIEERIERTDDTGDPIPYWRTWRTVWAAVEPIGGRELLTENQIHALATTRIRMRFLRGINAKMRIRHSERIWNIETILEPLWEREVLEVLCTDGLNDG